jgi:hypothetical protein
VPVPLTMTPRLGTPTTAAYTTNGTWARAAPCMLLLTMAILMLASLHDDVVTVDERTHIAPGYSYLVRADYRLNVNHPPLMKDLAALPLLFMHLRVRWDDPGWTERQPWRFGGVFLYESGRSPDKITTMARIPMILFTVGLGWMIFWWTARTYGSGAALLALFLYTFSPTFLAHGRLVNTDVGAAAGMYLGTISYIRVLRHPRICNLVLAGSVIGLAFLAKFSTLLLVPAMALLTVLWTVAQPETEFLKPLLRRLLLGGAVLVLASLVVYGVYLHHTWNSPRRAAESELKWMGSTGQSILASRVLRPWGYYLVGIDHIRRRVSDSTRPFFLGRVVTASAPSYFPVLYLIKEPLALHVLTLVVLLFAPWWPRRPVFRGGWLRAHFTECALVVVCVLYWCVSVLSSLQIGVRHVLPTFPFVYTLVGAGIAAIASGLEGRGLQRTFGVALVVLLAWQAVTILRVHPSYIAYFNEIAGGPDGGAEWAGDSNLDWGQDLRRLERFMNARGIDEIRLDYFGGADADAYLHGRYVAVRSCSEPQRGWVAVSAFSYQWSRRTAECDYRRWLTKEWLVTKIGYSIFVFHVDRGNAPGVSP